MEIATVTCPKDVLPAGTAAQCFTLRATPDQSLSRSELRGRRVVLIFCPADWIPVCNDGLAVFNVLLPGFGRHAAQLFGISVERVWRHTAFADARNLRFTLLADFEPKGEVARTYGVYRAKEGISERARILIGPRGVIAWREVSPVGIDPGAGGVLLALETMTAEKAGCAGATRRRP